MESTPLVNWSLLEDANLPDLHRRKRRYTSLMSDILELNQSQTPHPQFPEHQLEPPSTLAMTAGALYVLEGSVHGGQVILKQLRINVPQLKASESAFLSGFGADTQLMWGRFGNWLNKLPLQRAQRNEACQAARTVFSIFRTHLAPTRNSP